MMVWETGVSRNLQNKIQCDLLDIWKWKSLSHVQLFVTPWTVQSPEFSRPEY